ncbi:MAG: arsenic resistance N-acetyltransferase ArsN2 [Bacteroidetes bacterium]|nr:arsenic resistance N-acetyltransferase ArsN2 [Bacteroidota bacterium]
MTLRPATNADRDAIAALLAHHRLPLDGFRVDDATVAVANDGTLLGLAALERYDGAALLRSVAVADAGQGVGATLVRHLLGQADAEGRRVVLLTTTADGYFPRFGFSVVSRDEVPASVQASEEFRGACPASAVAMMR